jgi:hypothetical protein
MAEQALFLAGVHSTFTFQASRADGAHRQGMEGDRNGFSLWPYCGLFDSQFVERISCLDSQTEALAGPMVGKRNLPVLLDGSRISCCFQKIILCWNYAKTLFIPIVVRVQRRSDTPEESGLAKSSRHGLALAVRFSSSTLSLFSL